jgi:hypothetical protein
VPFTRLCKARFLRIADVVFERGERLLPAHFCLKNLRPHISRGDALRSPRTPARSLNRLPQQAPRKREGSFLFMGVSGVQHSDTGKVSHWARLFDTSQTAANMSHISSVLIFDTVTG